MISAARRWCLCALLVASGLQAGQLPLDRPLRLPDGLRLRVPRGFSAVPQAAPRIATYGNSNDDRVIEAIVPIEQWRYRQQIARFTGPQGELTLARIKHRPIEHTRLIGGGHAIKKDYDQQLAKTPPPDKPEEFHEWIEAWTDRPTNPPQTKVRGVLLRVPYMRATFPNTADAADQVWLLAFPSGAIMLRLQFPDLSDVDANRTTLAILKSISEIRAQVEPGGRPAKGDRLASTRAQVLQGIRNVPGWWTAATPNYVIASNLPRRSRSLVDDMSRDVELIRKAYETLFPAPQPIDAVSVIRVFADEEGYRNYVAPDMRWTSGVWDPSRKELVIAGDGAASSRDLREKVLNTAWHEAFHQYLFYALNRRSPPIWLSEGFACLFESCDVDAVKGRMRIEDNESRRQWLQHALEERPEQIDVERLLRMNRLEFYRIGQGGKSAEIARSDNYAMAWGMAWFLTKAAPLYRGRGYERIVPAILEELAKNDDTLAVANAGASATNLNLLQRDFVDFWTDSRKQGKAERHQLLPNLR